MEEFVKRTIEDQAALAEHEKGGIGIGLSCGERNHAILFRIEAMVAKGEGVLKAVGNQESRGRMDVSLLDDEFDDGGRGDGIEAAGRRVVEDQLRAMDEGARDGHAPLHAARKAGGIKAEGFFQTDKAERLADPAVGLFVGHMLLNQLIGDIVAHGKRIEKRSLLEDHSGARAQGKELLLGHAGDIFAEEQDTAILRAKQPEDEFEQHALAHAGGPEHDARFRGRYGKGDVLKHRGAIEGYGNAAQGDDGARVRLWSRR